MFAVNGEDGGDDEELQYPIYDIRGITDVNEVVENLEKAFELRGGIYNFGSPNDRNTYETVLAMFEELRWNTGRIGKNEEAFSERPRDISMAQEKLNACGITFTPTVEALVRNGSFITSDLSLQEFSAQGFL